MTAALHCITGKARYSNGSNGLRWCQDCGGFHRDDDIGSLPLRISVRTVAHMLHDDEISPRDAALTLFMLTQEIEGTAPGRHD